MKESDVTYFGDDFGWGFYTFKNANLIDCIYYLFSNHHFEPGWTSYKISKIIQRKKYWFFGENTVIIELSKN